MNATGQTARRLAVAFAIALVPSVTACEVERRDDPAGAAPEPFVRTARPRGIQRPITGNEQVVADALVRVADRALKNPAPFDVRDWPMAALYDGLIDTSLVTGDPQYLAAVLRAGQRSGWSSGPRGQHAGGHATVHAWLRLYLMREPRDPEFLEPFEQLFAEIAAHPVRGDGWTWADALYVAPPAIALLAQATGDQSYLRFMDDEFRFAYDALFDPEENLFHRDATHSDDRTPNGHKVFWSRGNAAVHAGLAQLLDALPHDYPTRTFYVALFRRVSGAARATQEANGFWYPSLLDPEHIYIAETSGSALFVAGAAWGLRQGVLDDDTYWPIAERGWNAIAATIDHEGAVPFAQPDGELSDTFDAESRATYGTGAVLMAGAEILRAADAHARVDPAELVRQAELLALTAPDLATECEDPCGSILGHNEAATDLH
jgi:rhamnogalacturonyl hydrolase YesR